MPCTRGTSWSCFGPSNCNGRQVCGSDGVLGQCVCPQNNNPQDSGMGRDGGGMSRDSGGDPGRDAAPAEDAGPDAATGTENCNNDTDDDGDGDADCADSDCAERTCAPAAPAGWDGPVLLYEGDSAPPACSGAYADEAVRGGTTVTPAAASCSACTCSPTSASCASFLNFETSLSSTCDAAPASTCTFPVNSSCQELTSPCLTQPTGYLEALAPGGVTTCTPSTSTPTLPAVDWDRHALACAPEQQELARAGCDADELCMPERPFDGELCIYDYFDVPCPAGPYTDRRVYGTHIADTRDCTECGCSYDCSYTWRVFDPADATCAGTVVATLSSPNECTAVTPGAGGQLRVNTTIAGTGACAPSGGAPTGTAQSENPVTVCCLP